MGRSIPRQAYLWGILGMQVLLGAIGLAVANILPWIQQALAADAPAARGNAYVASLSTAEQEQLLARWESFQKLDPARQQELRALHDELNRQPDAEQLRGVLERYAQWLASLSAVQRAELEKLPAKERIARIKQLQQEQSLMQARQLSADDMRAIGQWMQQRLLESVPETYRAQLEQMSEAERHRTLVRLAMQRWMQRDPRERQPLSAADVAELRSHLSPEGQARLDRIDVADRQMLVADWVRASVWRQLSPRDGGGAGGRTNVDEQELRRFYHEELSETQREHLLELPADEMQRQLRQMYFQRGERFGPGPRPDFGRGGPPQGQERRGPPPDDRRGPGPGPRLQPPG